MAINFPSTTGQATDGSFTYTDSTAGITWTWDGTSWSAGGVGSAITIKDEGTELTTAASSLDFVGLGVTASGTTGDKTITISGGGGGSSYTDSDVDTHLNTSTASTNQVLTWNGTDYAWGASAGYSNSDVDTHLNQSTALTNQVLTWNGTDYDWSGEVNVSGTGQFDNLRVTGISTFVGIATFGSQISFAGTTFGPVDSGVGQMGSIQLNGDGAYQGYAGYNINGKAAFFHNDFSGSGTDYHGLFDTVNQKYSLLYLNDGVGGSNNGTLIYGGADKAPIHVRSDYAQLNYINGSTTEKKLITTGIGVSVTGDLVVNREDSTSITSAGGGVLAEYFGTTSSQDQKWFTVTVDTKTGNHRYSTGSSSAYYLNGIEAPFLILTPGYTYKFDTSDPSNAGHPLLFYLEADKTTQYTTNVTTFGTPGSASSKTNIQVTEDTPSVLYYQCSAHGYMGNAVQTSSPVAAKLQTARTLELSGAVSGSTTFDGSGNANINTTSNITLGTDTSGNYVATVAGTTNEIEVTGSGSGGAAVTVGLPNDVTISGTMTAGTLVGSLASSNLTGALPALDGSALTGIAASPSVTDETTSTNTFYPLLSDGTSGTVNTKVSSTKLNFTPSTGNLEATQFTSLSDRSKKTNIRPIQNALDITKQLDGVRFDWKDNDKESIGVIAQDVEMVLPELVETSDDGTKSVAYQNMVAVLIEAVKEQQKQIDRQQELINQLMEG